jgi:DNA polymerase I
MHTTPTDTVVTISTFRHLRDKTPKPRHLTVADLFAEMTNHLAAVEKGGALWSPVVFDGPRKSANAVEASLLVFDIDDGTSPIELITWLRGLHVAVASTHKSTSDAWRLRVLVELTEPIPAAEYRAVWDSAVEYLLHGHVDGSTNDLARMFYLPTHKPGTAPFAQVIDGEALDWKALPRAEQHTPVRPILGLEDIAGLDAGDERRRALGLLRSFANAVATASKGERHATILAKARAAGGLRAYLDYDEIMSVLLTAAEQCGEVGDYGEDQVRRTIEDGINFGEDAPWTPAQLGGVPRAKVTGARAKPDSDDGEDDEDRRMLYEVPAFPSEVLPPELNTLCEQTSLPTTLVAGAGLATLALAVGGDAEIARDISHVERAILFTALVGPKSVGKSPSIDLALRPLSRRQDLTIERWQREMDEWMSLDPQDRKAHPRPSNPKVYGGDTTGSAWVRDMKLRRDMGRVFHEMSQTLQKTQSGRDHQAQIDMGLLLHIWSGNSVSYTRTGTGRGGGNDIDLYVPTPTCTILGDLQPKFHYLLGEEDDGMRPRWFPFVWTARPVGQRRYPSNDALISWDDRVHVILKRREGLDRVGMRLPRRWRIDDADRGYVDDLVQEWQERTDGNASYQAALTKAETNFLRWSLVLAEAAASDLQQLVVSRDVLERAAALVEYGLKCWQAIGGGHDEVSLTPLARALDPVVEKLRAYIEEHGETLDGRRFITAGHILHNGICGANNRATRNALVDRYEVTYPGCVEKSVTGGRPTTRVWAPQRHRFDPHKVEPTDPQKAPKTQTKPAKRPAKSKDFSGSPDLSTGAPDLSTGDPEPSPRDQISGDDLTRARGRAPASARVRAQHSPPQPTYPDAAYEHVRSSADFRAALAWLTDLARVGVDSETTTLHAQQGGRMRLLQLAGRADGERRVFVNDLDAIEDWKEILRTFLTVRPSVSTLRQVVFQEAVFDLGWFVQSELPIPPWRRIYDTRLVARLTERRGGPGYKYDLRTLAKHYLGVVLPKELQASDWSAATLTNAQFQYAANDAAVLLDIAERQDVDLQSLDIKAVFSLEHQVLPAMVWLREAGAPVDVALLKQRTAEATALRDQKLADLHALAGTIVEVRPPNGRRKKDPPRADAEMNWGSTSQLKPRLASMGVKIETTRKQELLALDPMPQVVEALLAWRGARKLADYGRQLSDLALIGDRVYGSFDSLGAASGRTSCRKPNLQQMHRGPHYREAIAAPEGRTLVKVDYTSLQMRIAADISGDQALIDLFNSGGDPHALTAVQVLQDVNGRQTAKSINFGLLFGANAATLRTTALTGYGVHMSLQQAEQYRSAFFSLYPGLLAWHQRFEHKRRAPLDIEDPSGSGRVRRAVNGFNERINTPVQMVEVHGMKRAMTTLHARRNEFPDARLVLSVHDELVMECPIDQAVDVGAWLQSIMQDAMQPLLDRVPIETEPTIAPCWWVGKETEAPIIDDVDDVEDEE